MNMDDKEKGMMAWLHFGEALEDFGLHVVRKFGVWHLELDNGYEVSKGTKLFYQIMNYFDIKTTAGLLNASPEKRGIVILARNVDLFYI